MTNLHQIKKDVFTAGRQSFLATNLQIRAAAARSMLPPIVAIVLDSCTDVSSTTIASKMMQLLRIHHVLVVCSLCSRTGRTGRDAAGTKQ